MTKDKKGRNEVQGSLTNGMTIEEWSAMKFKDKTGVTPDEWYANKMQTTTPFDFINECYGTVTEDDIKLVKDLQLLGIKDGVINILLHYVVIFSRVGMVHSLVKEMGGNWHKENISTVEKAINFVREEQKKVAGSSEKDL